MVELRLLPGRDKAVRDGHPWIFSGAIAATGTVAAGGGAKGAAAAGRGAAGGGATGVGATGGAGGAAEARQAPLARVFDAAGHSLGLGFYSPRSQIRVRMLGQRVERADQAFFAARLHEAMALRRAVLPLATTGFRLLNAEGDGIPGWTVDRFGDVLVSQITVAGLEALRGTAYAALGELLPECSVLQWNAVPARRGEGLPVGAAAEAIAGAPPAEAPFTESGFSLTADLAGGQKTGFYCDQRENRRLAERLAGGRQVLDLFAHAGAFGMYALRGGARHVTHVESSEKLIERGRRQHAANGFDAGAADWVRANVWEHLRQEGAPCDMVICDPPPLVRKRADLDAAARAYKDLNRLALGRLAPNGLLLTFSCSGAVDAKLFRQILFAAAVEAKVRVALLSPLAAAPDHPVAITHPQGEYLKGWLAVVSGPVS
ncbi:MAG TPA: class I SAM-dependent rRNA methyltransferase [Thermoanaerobaculia bacterium]|nr:class I SAM-dependent rRNA methyltransferase [Thermoanaerobaculia bacterium]